jgi:hypothetical protein
VTDDDDLLPREARVMQLQQIDAPEAYLAPARLIDVDAPAIGAFVETHLRACDDVEAARRAFHFVRDEARSRKSVSRFPSARRTTRSITPSSGRNRTRRSSRPWRVTTMRS